MLRRFIGDLLIKRLTFKVKWETTLTFNVIYSLYI
jgi:hypothetical protein